MDSLRVDREDDLAAPRKTAKIPELNQPALALAPSQRQMTDTIAPTSQSNSDRDEFREVLRKVVQCLRTELAVPCVSPFNASEIAQWMNEVTAEDVHAVWDNSETNHDRKPSLVKNDQVGCPEENENTRA